MTKVLNGIKVTAPAVLQGPCSGLVSMALAIEALADEIIVKKSSKKGIWFSNITGDQKQLPRTTAENTAGLAAQYVHQFLNLGCQKVGLLQR